MSIGWSATARPISASTAPDFLTANDAWFMPVVQKTGPDGCLYILDWYDRYHCYQDAGRDPQGIDRLKGRLYRVRYKDTPRAAPFDLAKETDEQLIARLASPNVFYRDLAQRLLGRAQPTPKPRPQAGGTGARRRRAAQGPHARPVGADRHRHARPRVSSPAAGPRRSDLSRLGRARGGQFRRRRSAIRRHAIAALWPAIRRPTCGCKWRSPRARSRASMPLPCCWTCWPSGDDKLIPHIVWQNLHPLLEDGPARFSITWPATAVGRVAGAAGG